MGFRVGHGQDIHRIVEGRPMLLGGVRIPGSFGLLGHSDGDVVLHAVADAILGALGGGDIGEIFPDTDERHRGADSAGLLAAVVETMRERGFSLVNLDLTVTAERPRLAAYRDDVRRRIAEILGAPSEAVNFKAKTNEGLDAVGRGEAITATAVVLLRSDSVD